MVDETGGQSNRDGVHGRDQPDDRSGRQVGVRLPGHLYRWLKEKIASGEYTNMAQSVIGELTKARALEERRDEGRRRPRPAPYDLCEETGSDPMLRIIDERLAALRREMLEEMERRREKR